jgi:hypothetical protein
MGLLRGMARTAVVAGTATAVSNRVSQRQARRGGGRGTTAAYPQQSYPPPAYPQQSYPPPAPPAPGGSGLSAQLAELTEMRDRGVLTEQEFAAAKAKLLGI